MKKTFFIALCILNFLFTSCDCSEKPIVKNENEGLTGTWKMVYAHTQDEDTLQVKDLSQTAFIKIINPTHFAFFNQNKNDATQFYGGGGTYKLDGNNYTETLTYTGVDAVRGHEFPFTIEIKGDTLIQSGLEEVKEANMKRYIVEKYVKIN